MVTRLFVRPSVCKSTSSFTSSPSTTTAAAKMLPVENFAKCRAGPLFTPSHVPVLSSCFVYASATSLCHVWDCGGGERGCYVSPLRVNHPVIKGPLRPACLSHANVSVKVLPLVSPPTPVVSILQIPEQTSIQIDKAHLWLALTLHKLAILACCMPTNCKQVYISGHVRQIMLSN